jgi:ectoine hydroxylase-related dioxygenase (phytanoyl-CoA dioxygenase family)
VLLDEEALRQFAEQGYCLPRGQLFSPDAFARVSALCVEHMADRDDVAGEDLDKPHLSDERFLEFLLSPEVLDVVEPICGPDIVLGSSHLIAKEAGGHGTPWHEDSAYLACADTLTDYTKIVSVWLSVNGSTEHNGCMRVIPGTYLTADSETYRDIGPGASVSFAREAQGVDESAAISLVLAPGECSLHDGRLMHASFPNRSADYRIGLAMRYFPATVGVRETRMQSHLLWLARGRSYGMNSYENV